MSKRSTHHDPIYITVEPTSKQDKLLLSRLGCYLAILSFLLLNKFLALDIPESIYWVFASSAAGLEIGQLVNLIRRK